MRQIQVTKVSRTSRQRRASLLDELPLDPRDPDITRAKRLQRDAQEAAVNVETR